MAAPRFRQIAEELIRRIDNGAYPEGTQLPTEVQLMDEFDASRNTIRDAVKLLIGRGLVHTSPGRGTFVLRAVEPFALTLASVGTAGQTSESEAYRFEARLQGREANVSDPRVEIKKAAGSVAQALGIEAGQRVVIRHQERRIDGRPWSLQTSWYPMAYVTQGADRLIDAEDIREGVVKYLQEELGVEQAGYRDKITARVPNAHEASFFNLPDSGSTVIVHDRIAYGRDKKPIRLTNTVYPADRNELYVEVGDVPPRTGPTPTVPVEGDDAI
ncbi:GntR family transcriptional regulator [Thermomonospora echinospora]|uniref:GntR family transcriptional regulator n=1 Tax=Thermomonospora echinospora TaxID=1992 RepID=A0A1H5YTE3_9ACTN|nr:GntR family transcriptional regulator [Thermomonospora echinospora]SEG27473.1 GntR family transcriptional regulator [Thermomonospora echinospora]